MSTYAARYFAAVLVLVSGLPVAAAPKIRVPGVSKEFSIPAGGVKLRVPACTESQPLPAPAIHASRPADGAAIYKPEVFWRHAQLLGVWSGFGTFVLLAEMKYPPPASGSAPETAEAFREQWQAYPRPPDEKEAARWSQLFFKEKIIRTTQVNRTGDVYWRRLETENRKLALFVGHGEIGGQRRTIALSINWINFPGNDDGKWHRLAERCALSLKLTPLPKSKLSGTAGSYAERLAQAEKSISGLRGWYVRKTTNYIFISNQRNRSEMRRLQNDLELARKIFHRYFPIPPGQSGVGVVKLFAERDEYLRYVGPAMAWTGGVWNPSVRELLVSPLGTDVDDKMEEKFLREVALHEGFHQYIFYASRETNPALWINEGCAQFFENSSPRRGEIGTLDDATEKKLSRAAAAAEDDLRRFISLDHAGFYAEKEREHNYALAHALLYYLLRGAPALGEKEFAALPRRYIEALRETRNPKTAQERTFADIDTRELAAKLKAFWSDRRQLRKAERYQ